MLFIKRVLQKALVSSINNTSRFFYRIRNSNKDFTLISRDCVGGIVYNQLGLRFLTPTINLFFAPDDFNQFCLHLKDYLNGFLVELTDVSINYPVGLLYPCGEAQIDKPVKIHFMHYNTFEDATKKWEQRKKELTGIIYSYYQRFVILLKQKLLLINWWKIGILLNIKKLFLLIENMDFKTNM